MFPILAFYIVTTFHFPTKASTKKKCFFINKNTFFTCSQLSSVPITSYVHVSPYHLLRHLIKKEKHNSFIIHWKIRLRRKKPSERASVRRVMSVVLPNRTSYLLPLTSYLFAVFRLIFHPFPSILPFFTFFFANG